MCERSVNAPPGGDQLGRCHLVEPIADAAHRVDPARPLRVVAELLAQGLHMGVDGARVTGKVVAPHACEELLAPEYLSRMGHEEREEIELFWLERDLTTVERHTVTARVE